MKLTRDHVPSDSEEAMRIFQKRGRLFRVCRNTRTGEEKFSYYNNIKEMKEANYVQKTQKGIEFGPMRTYPGGLPISRSIGNLSAKDPHSGGLEDLISHEPDIYRIDTKNLDFLIMASNLISK